MRFLPLVIALLLPAAALAADTKPGGPITCTSPIAQGDTAKSLKAKYGKNAVIKKVPGAEGEENTALVLYPKDKKNELIVSFFDDAMTQLSGVAPGGDPTNWTIFGLTMGSSLEDVQKANGKIFDIAGFDWDYGGFVTGWHGGALDSKKSEPCSISVRFATNDPNLPTSMSGDGVTIKSNNPRLAKAKPVVQMLTLGFAQPKN